MEKQVDILLATYNGDKFLEEQLNSIFTQSFQDFHLIIRDDQSTDNSKLTIESFKRKHPDKITHVEDGEHIGVCGSFSKLLEFSKAPYVMFADQDDVWLKDKVLKTLEKIQKLEVSFGKNTPLLVHSDLKVVDANLVESFSSFWSSSGLKPKEGARLNRLIVQNEVSGCAMMLNDSLRNLAIPIPNEAIMHDWWIALIASAFGHIGVVKEPLILYRQHGANALGAQSYRPIRQVWKKLTDRSNLNIRTDLQVSTFLKRFKSKLSLDQNLMMNDYLLMGKLNFFKQKYLIIKHGFFKHGLCRNLYALLLTKHTQ